MGRDAWSTQRIRLSKRQSLRSLTTEKRTNKCFSHAGTSSADNVVSLLGDSIGSICRIGP